MEDLRTTLADRFDLATEGDQALPGPGSTPGLVDLQTLGQTPDIGQAGTERYGPSQTGSRTRRLADLIGKAKELGGLGEVPIQNGVAAPVLTDRAGNLYIVRMTDVDPARAPASLDEVRPEVIEDLQRLANWNTLLQETDDLDAIARAEGLKAIAEAHGQTVQGPAAFQRNLHPNVPRGPSIRGFGSDQALIDAMVDRSIELGTAPLSETDRVDRVLVLPSDRNMAVLVAELDRRNPIQQAQYDAFLEQGALVGRIMANEFGGPNVADLAASFTPEALAARNRFVRGETDEEAENGDAADAPQTTADASE